MIVIRFSNWIFSIFLEGRLIECLEMLWNVCWQFAFLSSKNGQKLVYFYFLPFGLIFDSACRLTVDSTRSHAERCRKLPASSGVADKVLPLERRLILRENSGSNSEEFGRHIGHIIMKRFDCQTSNWEKATWCLFTVMTPSKQPPMNGVPIITYFSQFRLKNGFPKSF